MLVEMPFVLWGTGDLSHWTLLPGGLGLILRLGYRLVAMKHEKIFDTILLRRERHLRASCELPYFNKNVHVRRHGLTGTDGRVESVVTPNSCRPISPVYLLSTTHIISQPRSVFVVI